MSRRAGTALIWLRLRPEFQATGARLTDFLTRSAASWLGPVRRGLGDRFGGDGHRLCSAATCFFWRGFGSRLRVAVVAAICFSEGHWFSQGPAFGAAGFQGAGFAAVDGFRGHWRLQGAAFATTLFGAAGFAEPSPSAMGSALSFRSRLFNCVRPSLSSTAAQAFPISRHAAAWWLFRLYYCHDRINACEAQHLVGQISDLAIFDPTRAKANAR